MTRFICMLSLFATLAVSSLAQSTSPLAPALRSSDPQAINIATKSVLAMTGGSSVTDARLNATVTWLVGSTNETGSGTFSAKGPNFSRVDLDLSDEKRSETRSIDSHGIRSGQRKKDDDNTVAASQHNCWTDATWFFPALTSLTQFADPSFSFSYLGQEQHNGLTSLHLRVIHTVPGDTVRLNLSRYTAMDFYLDPASYLPSAIDFALHFDTDLNRDVPTEIRFADYKLVHGVQVPFHIQRLLNNSLLMDAVVTTANINTGLADAQFNLQ